MPPRWVTTAPPPRPRRATINDDVAPDELTPAMARELLEAAADDGRVLGQDPATGHDVVARAGRYGPYVTEVLPEADEAPAKGRGKAAAQGEAAHGIPVQGHGPRDHRPRHRAEAAVAAAGGRRRPRTARRSPRRTAATGPT